MKKATFFIIILIFSFISSVLAQTQIRGDADTNLDISADNMKKENTSSISRRPNNYPRPQFPNELKIKLKITKDDELAFKQYLENSKTKIAKIWNNYCFIGKVIDVEKDKECVAFSGYELGSNYSFESKNYVSLASGSFLKSNIGLMSGNFIATNISDKNHKQLLTQIITDLGEGDLNKLDENNAELKNFSDIQILDSERKSIWKEIQKKYEEKGIKYSDKLSAKLNHIYLLRSIFLEQHTFSLENRETIYAFQVVKIENNIYTILWKNINSKKIK